MVQKRNGRHILIKTEIVLKSKSPVLNQITILGQKIGQEKKKLKKKRGGRGGGGGGREQI
jgi:hypothetical protein